MSNPYIQRDIDVIVNAFMDSTVSTILQTPTNVPVPTRNDITGVPNWLKNAGGESSVAALSNRLQNKIDEAKGFVDSLYSYSTYGTEGTTIDVDLGVTSIQGIEMRNTWYTMFQGDDAGAKLKTLVADCIPCKDRVVALLSLNPIEDVWKHFDRMYKQSTFFLVDLYDLFLGDHSVGVFADLCNLLNFLNFNCVPDLAAIIVALSRLLTKYAFKFKDLEISFNTILGRFVGPTITPLLSTVDKYIQLIFAPIECIIGAIDLQLQKVDVQQAWKRNMLGKKDTERTFSVDEAAGSLKELRKYLQVSVDEARKEWRKLDESMKDLLGVTEEMDKQLLDVTYHMEQTGRFIGLIQAVIAAIYDGSIQCGPGGVGEEELQNFLANYVNPNFDVSIATQDGQARLAPRVPSGIDNLLKTVGKYQQAEDTSLPETAESKAGPAKVGQVVIPLKNCLYTTTDKELDQVKDFLSTYQQE